MLVLKSFLDTLPLGWLQPCCHATVVGFRLPYCLRVASQPSCCFATVVWPSCCRAALLPLCYLGALLLSGLLCGLGTALCLSCCHWCRCVVSSRSCGSAALWRLHACSLIGMLPGGCRVASLAGVRLASLLLVCFSYAVFASVSPR